jgi:hypothetical protein
MKILIKPIYLFISLFFSAGLFAQDLDRAVVKKAVQDQEFTFKAQTAFPMGGNVRHLTPGYDLRISGDSLSTYLPFFGRAYSAPLPGEGPIKFQSDDFSYKASVKKKQSWEIVIEPEDTREVRQMILRIFENGHATLMVNSNDRQSISFSGYITVK